MKIMNDNILIRLITEQDLIDNKNEILEMLNENYRINFPHRGDLSVFANTNYSDMKKFSEDGLAIILGAFMNGKTIGFLWAYKRIFLGEPRIHISHVVVNSRYRGNGIGTKMMALVERLALQEDINIIELITTSENLQTIQFYENCGLNITRVQFEKNLGEKNDN